MLCSASKPGVARRAVAPLAALLFTALLASGGMPLRARAAGSLASMTPPEPPPSLTPAQQAAAIERGKFIVADTFSVLSSNLQSAMASGGLSNALPFCALSASPLTASVATRHGVALRRITHQPRNPAARADVVETAILDGFRAALVLGTPPPPFATNLLAGQATFFAPIVLNNARCLKCHGEVGKDIGSESLALIQRHYPQDEATGFKLGDLRGAWRIDFPLAKLENATKPNETK